MNELARYLIENLLLDFKGMDVEDIRSFLREDDSTEARALLSKIIDDNGVDELLLVLTDCLQEFIRAGISEDIVCDQLNIYIDS